MIGLPFKPFRIGTPITQPPPPPPPSGWAKEGRLAIPAQPVQFDNFNLLIDETAGELKQTANGGALTSASAQDVRFERVSDGGALAWDLVHYDGASGRLVAFVRPGTIAANARFDFRMLAGKSGATEQDMAGAWNGWTAAWFGASGTNREGTTARNLTVTSVTADSSDPWVGVYDGATSHMSHADGAFLNGMTEFAVEALVKSNSASTDARIIAQGPHSTDPRMHGVLLWFDKTAYYSGSADAISATLRVYDGTEYWAVQVESGPGVQTTDWMHLRFQWKSGSLPELYINGKRAVGGWTGRVRESTGIPEQDAPVSGTVQMPSGTLEIGGISLQMWNGRIGQVLISPNFIGPAHALARARNAVEPRRLYGISQFVAGSPANIPVVALPMEGSQTQSATTAYDVAAQAYDPDDAPSLTAAGGVTGAVSSATVNAGKLNVTSGASAGDGTAAFTITGGSTTSTSKVYVEVTGAAGSGEYPDPLRTVNVANSSELTAALASAQPGDHIVLADGSYGAVSMDPSGTAANPIVIRAENLLQASFTAIDLNGSYLFLWGVMTETATNWAADNTFRRCKFSGAGQSNGLLNQLNGDRLSVAYCEITGNYTAYGYETRFSGSNGPTGVRIKRLYMHDLSDGARFRIGYSGETGDKDVDTQIEYSLFQDMYDPDLGINIVAKATNIRWNYCTFRRLNRLEMRHGDSHQAVGCLFEGTRATGWTGVTIQSKNHLIHGCEFRDATRLRVNAGTVTNDSPPNDITAWERAYNVTLARCTGTAIIGEFSSRPYPADSTSVEAHSGTVTLKNETNTSQSGTSSYPVITPANLTSADVGPYAP